MEILKIISLLFTLFSTYGKSAEAYFSVERIEKKSYAIPLIINKEHPEVADRINQLIQMSNIYKLHKIEGETFFDNMMNDDKISGTTSLDYNILLNNEAVLSIQFNDETMAAYPDYHTSYLNFNSATGDLIDINELLTKQGIDHLNRLASVTFNSSIKDYNTSTINDESLDSTQRKEILEGIFQLTECNATYKIYIWGISQDAFLVEKERCFPHATQALDIGWSCEIKFTDLFRNDLTHYGKTLLQEKKADKTKHYNLKQNSMSLNGAIDNKHPFGMYLTIYEDGSIGGFYWYPKIGTPIELKGNKTINTIDLTEESGKFKFTLNPDGSISGNWTNKNEISFPITFK